MDLLGKDDLDVILAGMARCDCPNCRETRSFVKRSVIGVPPTVGEGYYELSPDDPGLLIVTRCHLEGQRYWLTEKW